MMMARIFTGALVCLLAQAVIAEPRVTYVGLGRYTCSGSDRECEPVRRRNDELELQRHQAREMELQRRELERQTEVLKSEQRRLEMERGRGY